MNLFKIIFLLFFFNFFFLKPNAEGEIKDLIHQSSYKGNWQNGFAEGKGEFTFSGGHFTGHFQHGKVNKKNNKNNKKS